MKHIFQIPKYLVLGLLFIYQKVFSPDHGWLFAGKYPYGFCKHYPTCSEYTRQAVHKHGVVKGMTLGGLRVARCNPFSQGGVDLVK